MSTTQKIADIIDSSATSLAAAERILTIIEDGDIIPAPGGGLYMYLTSRAEREKLAKTEQFPSCSQCIFHEKGTDEAPCINCVGINGRDGDFLYNFVPKEPQDGQR